MLKAGVGKSLLDELRGLLNRLEANLTASDDLESVILTVKMAKDMVDQETGQRGFIITGEESFLEPYYDGQLQFATHLAALRTRLAQDSDNLALLTQIELLAREWLERAAKPEINARHQMNAHPITMDDVSALIQQKTGKTLLDQIRQQFDNFIQTKNQLNAEHSKKAEQNVIWLYSLTIILTLGCVIIGLWIGISLSRGITRPLKKLTQLANQMAEGNLNQIADVQSRNEISQIIRRQDELADIGRAYDGLARYFQEVIGDIVQASQQLAAGQLLHQSTTTYQGDFIQIQKALEITATQLASATARTAEQDWLKTGQTQLNENLRGEQTVNQLAKKTIDYLTTYVEAAVGVFYLVKKSSTPSVHLQEIASYAYTRSDNSPLQFRLGEGLVGQAALEKKVLFCSHRPEEYTYIIRSGLSQTVSRYVLISPILYEETIKGVIEIGAAHALTDIQKTFLEQAMPSIGIAMNMAESRARMQELLEQSQQQTEELQSQSEELRTQQEELQQINQQLQAGRDVLQQKQNELEQRNEELQNQSEELQTQSEELRQTNEELEIRTKELEQQQLALEKSQAAAEKARSAIETKAEELELASRYKSEFLANMSHELRTPLNSLLILAQVLADNKPGNLTKEQQEYAKTIQSAGTDLLTLINDILDLSKVEAGKMAMNVEKISLSELIESIEQKFRPLADKKQLAFNISRSDDLPLVWWTDGQRLKQILNNLLSNAFKFTSQGEIRLEMWCPSSSEQESLSLDKAFKQDFLAFSVADTGIGIPADKKQLIFEAFQQVDGGTSRRYGGTGLGLSISRQLAKHLGGELELHTIEGEGSTFTLYLPNRIPPQPKQSIEKNSEFSWLDSTPSQTPKSEQTASVTELESLMDDRMRLKPDDKTLLIIEDDQKFSRILMKKAQEKDFKCLLVFDGRTGLTLACEYQPTAILLDIGLPEIDGWAVLEKLKEHPKTRAIPVHFISASEPQTVEALKMGAIGYLQKPVNQEQLTETFQSLEQFLAKPVKNLLLVAENEAQQQLLELVSGNGIEIQVATTKAVALQELQQTAFDCIIVDMDIEPASQLLEQMPNELRQTPIITYSERDLTLAEEVLLQRCATQLPIKSVNSQERLLEEVTLFLHQIETQLSDKQRQMLQKVHDKEAIFRHKKVLIVDDDMRNVFALTTVLEEKDMEVVIAENGQEALDKLQQHDEIAIVLMDIMMPGMDGYEAIRQIRQQPRYHRLPIIALTAKAMKGDKAKCISAGANDYLSKPVDIDKLMSLMRVWLYR
jgi:signal transduction histidine kinase/CheY-like chemotaxis protein/CHASE3 domain sensor protein